MCLISLFVLPEFSTSTHTFAQSRAVVPIKREPYTGPMSTEFVPPGEAEPEVNGTHKIGPGPDGDGLRARSPTRSGGRNMQESSFSLSGRCLVFEFSLTIFVFISYLMDDTCPISDRPIHMFIASYFRFLGGFLNFCLHIRSKFMLPIRFISLGAIEFYYYYYHYSTILCVHFCGLGLRRTRSLQIYSFRLRP